MKKLLLIPSALLGTAAVFSVELYRYTFCRGSSPLLSPFLDKKGHEDDYYFRRDTAAAALRNRPHERMEIRSSRGERLRGYYFPAAGNGKRIAFIVHGYRSEHAETAGMYFDAYAALGFDLFCCDHTAHGESEGHFIGFDFFESADCLLWLEELRRRFGGDVQIVLHGFSMGAATVLKMSADCPDNVKCILADCGYQSGETQLKASLGRFYPVMRLMNRLLAGYDLRATDVRPSLSRSRIPILFIHGRDDRSVPFFNGPALYEFYSGPKDCLFIDGAKHVECMYTAPEVYRKKMEAFIRPCLQK